MTNGIRGSAIGLLIAGGICLYFGLTWGADWPASLTEEEAARWIAHDLAFSWCLRVLGVLFLLSAVLAWAGTRVSMLLATICEVGFALLMVAMTIEWTLEARANGETWRPEAILLLILAVLAVGGASRSWQLHRRTGQGRPYD